MSKKLYALLALVLVLSLVLVGCNSEEATDEPVEEATEAPEPEVEPTEAPAETELLICQVTDVGGIDDKSFNATAWKGVENAIADFPGVEGKYLESQQQTDYETNLNAFVDEGCDLIFAVGFLMADATAAAAETYPDQLFATIDVDYLDFPNLRGSGFAINESTFLNGYLAAGMTKTGKVGTYVGIAFPATTIFMDGYVLGVEHYNAVHGTEVEVLGWDIDAQEGLATGDFENTDNGRAFGENLMDEGADIIMPVAGPVGLGTLAVMEERGSGLLVGVDDDWSLTNPASADYILSSAMKNMDKFVYETIAALVEGDFMAGTWIGTLENGGVGIAYGSAMADLIPQDLKDELTALEAGIIEGSIATLPGATTEPEVEAPVIEMPTVPELESATITIWHALKDSETVGMTTIIESFKEAAPGVEVDVLFVPFDDLRNKFETAAATGAGPDIVIGADDWGPAMYNSLLIADVSDVEVPGVNAAAYAEGTYKDAQVGLPYVLKGVVMYRNPAIIADAPATYEDLKAAAAAANDGDIVGAMLEIGVFFSYGHLYGQGGSLMDAAGDPTFNTAEGEAWLNMLVEFVDLGAGDWYTDNDVTLFKEGKVGLIIDGTWNIADIFAAVPDAVIDPWPEGMSGYVQSGYMFLNLNSTGANEAAAKAFMAYMLTPYAQAQFYASDDAFIPAVEGVEINDPIRAAAVAAFADGVGFQVIPEMGAYWGPMETAVLSVIGEGVTPADALATAFDSITTALVDVRAGE